MDKKKLEKARTILKTIELLEMYEQLVEGGKITEIKFVCNSTGRSNHIKRKHMVSDFAKYTNGSVDELFKELHQKIRDIILETMMKATEEFKDI